MREVESEVNVSVILDYRVGRHSGARGRGKHANAPSGHVSSQLPATGVVSAGRMPRSMNERDHRNTTAAASGAPELALLRLLEQHPEYSQRQMSSALGVSLGKAHYLLEGTARQRLGQGAELQAQPAQVALSVCPDAERRAPAPAA